MMNVCLCSVWEVEQGARSLTADSVFSWYSYGGIAVDKDVLVPVPCKALGDAFSHQCNVDK